MWFVNQNVIYHVHLKHLLFLFIFAAESYFHYWDHIIFSICCSMHHFCSYELIFTKYLPTVIWILFLLHFSSNVFLPTLKILRMCFIGKNIPAKQEKMGFHVHENGIPLSWDNSFSNKHIWILQWNSFVRSNFALLRLSLWWDVIPHVNLP